MSRKRQRVEEEFKYYRQLGEPEPNYEAQRALEEDEDEEEEDIPANPGFMPGVFYDCDWSTMEEEPTDDPEYCYFCEMSMSKHDIENDKSYMNGLTYIEENYHCMDPKRLSRNFQKYYNAFLRDYNSAGPKVFRCEMIFKHFEDHISHPKIILESVLRVHRNVMNTIRDSGNLVQLSTLDGRATIDATQYNLYCKAADKAVALCTKVEKYRSDKLLG